MLSLSWHSKNPDILYEWFLGCIPKMCAFEPTLSSSKQPVRLRKLFPAKNKPDRP